jgi:superfamily II DNA or RNA helicase
MSVNIVDIGKNRFKIVGLTDAQLTKLTESLSWRDPSAFMNKSFVLGLSDGMRSVISKHGDFRYGLLEAVYTAVHHLFNVTATMDHKAIILYKGGSNPGCVFDDNILPGITPLYYQRESAIAAMKKLRGVIKLPTASGKSATIGYIITHLLRDKPLWKYHVVLVPTQDLVEQFCDDLTRVYGIDRRKVGIWYADAKSWMPMMPILITTRASLALNDNMKAHFAANLTVIYNDECHGSGSDTVDAIMADVSPVAVYGFTGSMPKDKYTLHCVFGNNGPIIYRKDTKDLQAEGFLPGCTVIIVDCETKSLEEYPDHNLERAAVSGDPLYMSQAVAIIKREESFKRNSLILVQNVSAGRVLQQNTGYTFIHGENTSAGDNEIFKEILEKSDGVSFIATYQKYSTGISIKNLHTIMFYEQPAGDIKMIQSIGRGLRRHLSKVTDKPVRIIDLFTDKKYSKRHKSKRINTYEEEGFRIIQTTFDMVNGFVN